MKKFFVVEFYNMSDCISKELIFAENHLDANIIAEKNDSFCQWYSKAREVDPIQEGYFEAYIKKLIEKG